MVDLLRKRGARRNTADSTLWNCPCAVSLSKSVAFRSSLSGCVSNALCLYAFRTDFKIISSATTEVALNKGVIRLTLVGGSRLVDPKNIIQRTRHIIPEIKSPARMRNWSVDKALDAPRTSKLFARGGSRRDHVGVMSPEMSHQGTSLNPGDGKTRSLSHNDIMCPTIKDMYITKTKKCSYGVTRPLFRNRHFDRANLADLHGAKALEGHRYSGENEST